MALHDAISFRFGRRLPVLVQAEASECGLACLGMIAAYFGSHTDLPALRSRFSVSLHGTTLADLIRFAGDMDLDARPLRLELHEMGRLRLPCILHWELDHFVVLESVGVGGGVVHDPAVGRRRVTSKDLAQSFTGVALEVWPSPNFRIKRERRSIEIWRLLGEVTGIYRSASQVFMLAIVLESLSVVSPLFLQLIVDNVISSEDRDFLTLLAIGFLMLMVMQAVFTAIRSWVMLYVSTTISLQWRANVFRRLVRLPIEYFEKRHLGDVVSRFGSIDQIQSTLTTSFMEAILDGLMTIVTLAFMYMYEPTLSAIAVGAVLAYGLLRIVWYRSLFNATGSQIIFAARQQTHFIESVRGLKAIKLFGRERERYATWISVLIEQVNAQVRTQRLQVVYTFIHGVLSGGVSILVLWMGARMVLEGRFTIGLLTAFVAYRSQFDVRVTGLVDKVLQMRLLSLYSDRLADIVLAEPEPTAKGSGGVSLPDENASITVSNIRFRYAANEPWLLDGVSFSIEPGEFVALAGPSGAGKTTLVHIIMGLRTAQEGDVRVGGVSVRDIGTDVLRAAVGTVMQDDVLFAGTIAENICFFDISADRERIEECAKLAAIHHDVMSMPMGYNTLVGDMGMALSGGQKQRVLLARALYKRPRILILDEATSHLDIERERQVGAAISSLKLTRIVVAHRKETIEAADRCLLLSGGSITVESRRERQSQVSAGRADGDLKRRAPPASGGISTIEAGDGVYDRLLRGGGQPWKSL